MNNKVLLYLLNQSIKSESKSFPIPSIRWFSIKFDISNNEVIRLLNHFKDVGIIMSEHGSKNVLNKNKFLAFYKNDTQNWFGKDVKKKITKKTITKKNNHFVYKFDREFLKNENVIVLSKDVVFLDSKVDFSTKNFSIDEFIRKNIDGQKNVLKTVKIINIKGMKEYEKLKTDICVFVEVHISNNKGELVSHSFSLYDVNYYHSTKVEIMI